MSNPKCGELPCKLQRHSILLGLECESRLRLGCLHLHLGRPRPLSLNESKNGISLQLQRLLSFPDERLQLSGVLLALVEASRGLQPVRVPRLFESHQEEVT